MIVSLNSRLEGNNKEEEPKSGRGCLIHATIAWKGACLDELADVGGSHLRIIDSCITQLKSQTPFRTCNESEEEAFAWKGACLDELASVLCTWMF